MGANKMAQWIMRLAANPVELSLIPRIYVIRGGNQPYKLSSDFHMCTLGYM